MAYIRGEKYIWDDGERVHIWVADGFDHWQDSVWFEDAKSEASDGEDGAGPSGVALTQDVADVYVVMRFAQLVQERRVRAIVEHALSNHGGNGGCLALSELAGELLRSVEGLVAPREKL